MQVVFIQAFVHRLRRALVGRLLLPGGDHGSLHRFHLLSLYSSPFLFLLLFRFDLFTCLFSVILFLLDSVCLLIFFIYTTFSA